jgi:hypothetical protein
MDRDEATASVIPFRRVGLDPVFAAIVLKDRCQDGKLAGVSDPAERHVSSNQPLKWHHMIRFFDWLKIGAGALVGALVVAGPVYLYGKHQGRQEAAVAALEASIKAIQKREDIDHEVDRADLIDICVELGGVRDDCRDQLRGVGAPAETE